MVCRTIAHNPRMRGKFYHDQTIISAHDQYHEYGGAEHIKKTKKERNKNNSKKMHVVGVLII